VQCSWLLRALQLLPLVALTLVPQKTNIITKTHVQQKTRVLLTHVPRILARQKTLVLLRILVRLKTLAQQNKTYDQAIVFYNKQSWLGAN
jgi:hypothetical protein